jgi:hypothetical protein
MKMARRSEVLDLAVEGKGKKKSRKGLIVGIAMLGVIPVIGSTLAASISLNSGDAIEFGQGSQAVTACDNAITVMPVSSFNPTPSPAPTDAAGTFELASFTLSEIDDAACEGMTFTVSAYEADGTAIDLDDVASGNGITSTAIASGDDDVSIAVVGTVDSADLGKVTVESLKP